MSATATDHYTLLGIERGASPADVKRAFFQLVKVHRPEDDAVGFQAISEAYRVLSDPEARKAYDAEERLPPEVVAVFQRAAELLEKDPERAVGTAKSVLSTHGRSPLVRYVVACLCLQAGRAEDALPFLDRLVAEDPARTDYILRLAEARARCGGLDEAEQHLKRVVAIDGSRVEAYLALADVYAQRGRAADALSVLDGGMRAVGEGELRDLPLRIRKVVVLAKDGRWDEMERVTAAITASVPPGDPEALKHVAWVLYGLAEQYVGATVYDVARFLVDAAFAVDAHPALKARSDELAAASEATSQCRAAHRDERVAAWIRAILPPSFGQRMPDDEWSRLWNRNVERVAENRAACLRDWDTFRRLYPNAAQSLNGAWKQWWDRGYLVASKPNRRGLAAAALVGLVILVGALASASGPRSRVPRAQDRDYVKEYLRSSREITDRILRDKTPEERRAFERALRHLKTSPGLDKAGQTESGDATHGTEQGQK